MQRDGPGGVLAFQLQRQPPSGLSQRTAFPKSSFAVLLPGDPAACGVYVFADAVCVAVPDRGRRLVHSGQDRRRCDPFCGELLYSEVLGVFSEKRE